MADDIKDAGVIGGVSVFGVPWHGRVFNNTLYTGKLDAQGAEITRAWPMSTLSNDCWLVRVPGLTDPYAGAAGAALKSEHALAGWEFTDYALVSSVGYVAGVYIGSPGYTEQAWLWVDSNNVPWAVWFSHTGTTAPAGYGYYFNQPFKLRFNFVRFGELRTDPDATAEAHFIEVTLSDIGQNAPFIEAATTYGKLVIEDIDLNGTRAIFAVSSSPSNTRKLGFIEAVFSLDETGTPAAACAVISSRAQTLGTASNVLTYTLTYEGGISCYAAENAGAAWSRTIETVNDIVLTDRVIGYMYDDTGAPPTPLKINYSAHTYDKVRRDLALPGNPNTITTWAGPNSTTGNIALGANMIERSEVIAATSVEQVGVGVCSNTYENDTLPEGTTVVVQWSPADQAYNLYNMPLQGSYNYIWPMRVTSKIVCGYASGSQTLGVLTPYVIDLTVVDGTKVAAYNPATGVLSYPLNTIHQYV